MRCLWASALYVLLAAPVPVFGTDSQEVDGLRAVIRPLVAEQLDKIRTMGEALAIEARFSKAISDPSFALLDSSERHNALYAGSAFALSLSDSKQAARWIVQASEMPEAAAKDWDLRFRAAVLDRDKPDIKACITALAQRYPEVLSGFDPQLVSGAIGQLTSEKPVDRPELLGILFDAHYRYFGRVEPGTLWQDLARALSEHGDSARAVEVASRIDEVEPLISMRADRRYAPLLARNPFREDIPGALRRQVELYRQVLHEHPFSGFAYTNLMKALLLAGHFEEALAITDDRIHSAPAQHPSTQPSYDILGENWLYDYRARAYKGLGKWKEATEAYQLGSRRAEDGAINVSQTLNLAQLQCELGNGNDSRKAAAAVHWASLFGRMVQAGAEFCAAEELGDARAASTALAYLKDHREESFAIYQDALVMVNDLDSVAAILISRLQNENQRQTVLLELQTYKPGARTDLQMKWDARYAAVLARPDVKSVVDSVGRVDHYELGP